MRWTNDKPIKPGWYWWREWLVDRWIVRVVQVVDYAHTQYTLGHGHVKRLNGEWAGPLEPPQDEEEASS